MHGQQLRFPRSGECLAKPGLASQRVQSVARIGNHAANLATGNLAEGGWNGRRYTEVRTSLIVIFVGKSKLGNHAPFRPFFFFGFSVGAHGDPRSLGRLETRTSVVSNGDRQKFIACSSKANGRVRVIKGPEKHQFRSLCGYH
jgi:hypothetical protein